MAEDKKPALAAESKNERNTPYKQTARDAYRKLIATDPRFKEAPKIGFRDCRGETEVNKRQCIREQHTARATILRTPTP